MDVELLLPEKASILGTVSFPFGRNHQTGYQDKVLKKMFLLVDT